MKSQGMRLAFAAVLSIAGFLFTTHWYQSQTNHNLFRNSEPALAQVANVKEEVLRKQKTRLLWLPIENGDDLFNGETVRTSENSEMRIQFLDGRFIDLESESTVVLQKNQGEIALDLLEGGLFVQGQADDADTQLVLSSKNGKIDLSNAKANLSKSNNKDLDLRVFEGQANIQGKNGESKNIESGSSTTISETGKNIQKIEVLSPIVSHPLYFLTDTADVEIKFKNQPDKSAIRFLKGKNRKNLSEFTISKNEAAQITTVLPFGTYFWKLEAYDPESKKILSESSVQKFELRKRHSTIVTSPTNREILELPTGKSKADIAFRWSNSDPVQSFFLEVSSDANLNKKVISERLSGLNEFIAKDLPIGKYFFRLSSYFLKEENPALQTQSTAVFSFEVIKARNTQPTKLSWNDELLKTEQYYVDQPNLSLFWTTQNKSDEIQKYEIRYHAVDSEDIQTQEFKPSEDQAKIVLKSPGRFMASIVALGKENNILSQTEEKVFLSAEQARLQAPQIVPLTGQLSSERDGTTRIEWQSVTDAKAYQLTIFKDGKKVARKNYDRTFALMKNLMPGIYEVNLATVDSYNRVGPASDNRQLFVPDTSNLKAPNLKNIQVDD